MIEMEYKIIKQLFSSIKKNLNRFDVEKTSTMTEKQKQDALYKYIVMNIVKQIYKDEKKTNDFYRYQVLKSMIENKLIVYSTRNNEFMFMLDQKIVAEFENTKRAKLKNFQYLIFSWVSLTVTLGALITSIYFNIMNLQK